MNEADCKRRLVREVMSIPGSYAYRAEERYAVGRLDLVIKLPGLPILFAEGKLIRGYKFAPSPRQLVEGERMIGAGLKVALIGWKDEEMFISPWIEQADCRHCRSGRDEIVLLQRFLEETA